MKIVEFEATAGPAGIQIPQEVAGQIPSGERLHVVLTWGGSELADWRIAGRRQFEAAYASEDSIYEKLIDDAERR